MSAPHAAGQPVVPRPREHLSGSHAVQVAGNEDGIGARGGIVHHGLRLGILAAREHLPHRAEVDVVEAEPDAAHEDAWRARRCGASRGSSRGRGAAPCRRPRSASG